MQFKIVNHFPSKERLTSWQLKYLVKGETILDQNLHLKKIIAKYNFSKIHNNDNFVYWNKFHNSNRVDCDLFLYAHTKPMTLTEICEQFKNVHSHIFLAINKYLLLSDYNDSSLSDDYDYAILESLQKQLNNKKIIEHKWHSFEQGNVGNFIIPDNRFLIL